MDKRYVKQVGFWVRMWQGICGVFKKKKAQQSFCKNEDILHNNILSIVEGELDRRENLQKPIVDKLLQSLNQDPFLLR